MSKYHFIFRFVLSALGIFVFSEMCLAVNKADTILSYRECPTGRLYIYYPKEKHVQALPSIVFFFGGGWNTGSPKQFEPQADYLTKYGIVVILADYRTKSNAGTTPKESLMDAKSAMRFLRIHAQVLQLDADKILAGGGSAGGQLAAGTALCDKINSPDDDLSVSSVPRALILFNPAVYNGPGGPAYDKVKDYYKDFSPFYNVKKNAPPTIIFLGTKDEIVPVSIAEQYKEKMEEVGARCNLKLYPDQKHGFFNWPNEKYFEVTMKETVEFLKSLGYIHR